MSDKSKQKRDSRIRRHSRVRRNVAGTAERPRLAVFRSNRHIVAQVIGDHHQYPDGFVLYLGTLFSPVDDRDVVGRTGGRVEEDVGHAFARNRAVHAHVVGADPATCRKRILASAPELQALGFTLTYCNFCSA